MGNIDSLNELYQPLLKHIAETPHASFDIFKEMVLTRHVVDTDSQIVEDPVLNLQWAYKFVSELEKYEGVKSAENEKTGAYFLPGYGRLQITLGNSVRNNILFSLQPYSKNPKDLSPTLFTESYQAHFSERTQTQYISALLKRIEAIKEEAFQGAYSNPEMVDALASENIHLSFELFWLLSHWSIRSKFEGSGIEFLKCTSNDEKRLLIANFLNCLEDTNLSTRDIAPLQSSAKTVAQAIHDLRKGKINEILWPTDKGRKGLQNSRETAFCDVLTCMGELFAIGVDEKYVRQIVRKMLEISLDQFRKEYDKVTEIYPDETFLIVKRKGPSPKARQKISISYPDSTLTDKNKQNWISAFETAFTENNYIPEDFVPRLRRNLSMLIDACVECKSFKHSSGCPSDRIDLATKSKSKVKRKSRPNR